VLKLTALHLSAKVVETFLSKKKVVETLTKIIHTKGSRNPQHPNCPQSSAAHSLFMRVFTTLQKEQE
jgi:hypothetical protein